MAEQVQAQQSTIAGKHAGFIAGGGEMGQRIRTMDWSQTTIGPISTWPQSLRTTLSILLNSKFPMFLYWGPELLCFYNDAFRPSLGNDSKYPNAMGKPATEFWAESWHEVEPSIALVKAGGEATWYKDQLIPIYRNGKIENVYWTYSFSPVYDDSGITEGILVTSFETTQQVLTLAQLEESKDELSFAIEATELGTWDVNPATSKLKANARLKEWFGLKADEEVELQLAIDVIAEQDRQRVVEAIQRANEFSSGGHYDIEYSIFHPNTKEERIVRAKGRAWFNDAQEAYRFNGTLQDITSNVLARKRLEESESHFRNMMEQIPVAIALTRGSDHIFQDINPSMLHIVGCENKEEVIGRKVEEVLPELKGQVVMQILQDMLGSGEAFVGSDIPVQIRINGKLEQGYYNLSYTPLIEEGEIKGVIHAAIDVTEQVLDRKKVEDNERQLRIITDALPVLIGYIDKEEKYRFANQAYKSWFNQEPETLLGRPVLDVVGEKAYAGVKQYIDRALAGERLDFEARMPYRENFTKYIHTSYVPDIQDGEVVGFFTLVQDITEQVETRLQIEEREKEAQTLAEELAVSNEELQASTKQVRETNDMLSRSNQKLMHINADMDNFIYTASHDLRAPISNIEGLMNAIMRNLSPESSQDPVVVKLFGLMHNSVLRFKRTISDLTEITKTQREGSGEDVVQVDLAQILKEVRLDLSTQIDAAEATFKLDMQGCTPINFSAKNARSIVYNLISNAIKYRSDERKLLVYISCYQEGEYQVLQVQDNGLGMDISDKTKIFAMFKRLHNHVEGSGIGLYIVKKIVENAGGKIEVESTVGQGSTFRVYFSRF